MMQLYMNIFQLVALGDIILPGSETEKVVSKKRQGIHAYVRCGHIYME